MNFLISIGIGFLLGSIAAFFFNYAGKRPILRTFTNIEWYKVSEIPIPEEYEGILIYRPGTYGKNKVTYSITRHISYTKNGKPQWADEEITQWTYVPYPKEK